MNWYFSYTKYGSIDKYAEAAEELQPTVGTLLKLSPLSTPEMIRWMQMTGGKFMDEISSEQMEELIDAINMGKYRWQQMMEEQENQKKPKTTLLTRQQQMFMEKNSSFIKKYILDKLREKYYKGKIHPQFVPDQDTLEDIAEEGLLKVMEVISEKWNQLSINQWPYLKKAIDNIVDTLTSTTYPGVTENYLPRQYFPGGIREPQYSDTKKELERFLDALIFQIGGQEVFQKYDAQTLEELINYIANKYKDQIFEEGLSSPRKFTGDINRYKKYKLWNVGGRNTVEFRDMENISDEEIETAYSFDAIPQQNAMTQLFDKVGSDWILKRLNTMREPIRILAGIYLNIDLEMLGLSLPNISRSFGMKTPQEFLNKITYDDGTVIWGNIKDLVIKKYGAIKPFYNKRTTPNEFLNNLYSAMVSNM